MPSNLLHGIDRTSRTHVGNLRNAVDFFIVSPDTPILAAADGKVTYVRDDSNLDDLIHHTETFQTCPIMHHNGEHTRYDHIGRNNAKVMSGRPVRAWGRK